MFMPIPIPASAWGGPVAYIGGPVACWVHWTRGIPKSGVCRGDIIGNHRKSSEIIGSHRKSQEIRGNYRKIITKSQEIIRKLLN